MLVYCLLLLCFITITKKTTRIYVHLQNRPYKTTSRFLQNLTIPGKNHTEWIQNPNRKWIGEKKFFFFTLCHHTFENPFLLVFLIICLLALPHPNYNPYTHNIDTFLWHHIIVNIFSIKQVMPKSLWHKPFPTFFFIISSLKSISTFKTKNL